MPNKFAPTTDCHYKFEIYRHISPKEIRNLWTLKAKTPTDDEAITVCDADSLENCINKIGLVFENDGL